MSLRFTLPNPAVHHGIDYPFVGVSLVTSPRFHADSVSAQVVLKLDPYRIEGGLVERAPPELSRSIVLGDAYAAAAADPALAAAVMTISSGIQQYINARVV